MWKLQIIVAAALALSACGGGAAPTGPSSPGTLSVAALACPNGASQGNSGDDDWVTFGHDQLHTGCENGDTGISVSNVSQLHRQWEFSQGNQIFASPIVVGGSVYVATLDAGTVIALNAATGAQEWSTTLGASSGGEIRQTPVYDDGLLFVGIHGFGAPNSAGEYPPLPSRIYALNASTGQVVWSALLQGDVRASPAVANGEVFVPVAGGDPPFCLQGGISAFNEASGQALWNFYVDPTPSDGGSVWSPVSYDGTRLIFGTGNTCVQTPLSANAIVAINPQNGQVDWQLNTAPQLTDDDVGAGTMIVNGLVITIGKDGVIYYLDESTGAVLHEVQTGVANGQGGFSTPSTDGTTIILGTSAASSGTSAISRDDSSVRFFGRIRPSATSGGGRLIALDMSGNVKWTDATQSAVNTSVAITGGVAFADVNDAIEALAVSNGHTLWSYSLPAGVLASPVVVPSGVYAADLAGNVYKFVL